MNLKSEQTQSSTLQISEQDLRSTLNDFLESDDKKESRSIWNTRTILGFGFIFLAFAYIGNFIGTEIFGLSQLPFLQTVLRFAPYLAGAFLAVDCITMLKRKKKNKIMEAERNQETRDSLDKFLYPSGSKSKKSSKSKSEESFTTAISDSGRLMRSRTDKQLFGVCGGLAKHLGMSSTVLRIIFVAATIFGFGSLVLVYIAMAIVMPKEPIDFMDDFY